MDRPLNKRGKRDGPIMAHVLGQSEYPPQLIYTSDAHRTTETAGLINQELGVEIILDHTLYSARTQDVASLLWEVDPRLHSVAVVTHLPTIESCAWASGNRSGPLRIPTLTMLCYGFEGGWQQVDFSSGELLKVYRPLEFRHINTC